MIADEQRVAQQRARFDVVPAQAELAEQTAEVLEPTLVDAARESLSEISNSTVHALMHLGWIALDDGDFAPQMAVYVKHRGMLGRFYMRLIAPFRHLIVYPSLMRAVDRSWGARIGAGARSPRPQPQAILTDG